MLLRLVMHNSRIGNKAMKLSEQLQQDHDCGDFGKALEGYSERAKQLENKVEVMAKALKRIEKWHGEFPDTGKFWDEEKTRPTSFSTKYAPYW
jgi:hypothetical protein